MQQPLLIPAGTFTPDQKLLALSWKQPYAELMLHGKIETRTWPAGYRGWVLICASKTAYTESQLITIAGPLMAQQTLVYLNQNGIKERKGTAIAIGWLTDCRPMHPRDEARCWVKYHPGLFCHVYTNVMPIEPIPWKGTQGWRIVPDDIKQRIIVRELQ